MLQKLKTRGETGRQLCLFFLFRVSAQKKAIFCVCCNKHKTAHFTLLQPINCGILKGGYHLEGKPCFLEVHEDKRESRAPKSEGGLQVCNDCVRENNRKHDLHKAAEKPSETTKLTSPLKKRGRKPMNKDNWSPKTKQNMISIMKRKIEEAKKAAGVPLDEESPDEMVKFGKLALQYFISLQKRSSARTSFLKFASDKFSRPRLAKLLGVSTRRIKEALKFDDFIQKISYKPRVHSEKLSPQTKGKVEDWWLEVTHPLPHKATSFYNRKTKTFSQGPYYEQRDSDLNLIKTSFTQRTGLTMSYNTIVKYKPKTVHMAKQTYCVCHHCTEGRNKIFELEVHRSKLHRNCNACQKNETCPLEQQLKEEEREGLDKLIDAVKDYREHKKIADHQAKKMQELKDALVPGECLVIMDFAGRFIVQACLEMSQTDYFARVGVPDLVLYVYYREKTGGELKTMCFDLLSKAKEKDDYCYVKAAWLHLLNNETIFDNMKIIHIFSDGGPKHFKIRKSLFMLSLLNAYYPQTFRWHFFQSCHGKGPCDGHTGMLNMLLKREVLQGGFLQTDRDLFDLFTLKNKATTRFLEI